MFPQKQCRYLPDVPIVVKESTTSFMNTFILLKFCGSLELILFESSNRNTMSSFLEQDGVGCLLVHSIIKTIHETFNGL